MANEVLLKSRAEITAQDNSSSLNSSYDPNSASYTGGTPAVLDNRISAASGQPQGADSLNLILLVTTGPATAATAEIWYSESEDGTNYTKYKYSHTVGDSIEITTAGDRIYYDAGEFVLTAQYTKLAVKAGGYAIADCTLFAYPKLHEIQ